jgi:hypothetical protein
LIAVSGSIYGINGANLIGLTPKSIGAGGTGIALNTGFESLTKNPAILAKNRETQFFSAPTLQVWIPRVASLTAVPWRQ